MLQNKNKNRLKLILYTLLTFNICIYLINDCCLNSAFYFSLSLGRKLSNLPLPLIPLGREDKDKNVSNIKEYNKFTSLIMERLDRNIEKVALGQINKLDIRGGQLAALPLGGELSFFYFTIYLFLH